MIQRRKTLEHILAVLLSFLIVFTMIPTCSVYAAPNPSEVSTNLGGIQFTVYDEAKEFTVTTIAKGDAGEMVKGSFVFSDPSAIEKLEYYETAAGMEGWYELIGDFGPPGGFPMIDGTSKFRVSFKKAGNFNVTISIKKVGTDTELCSTNANVNVAKAKITGISISKTSNKYTGGEFALAVLNGNAQPGDTVSYEIEGDPTVYGAIPKKSAVGEYKVTITVDRGANYNVYTQTVTSEILLADIELGDLEVKGLEGVYTGLAQDAVTVNNKGDYSLEYKLDNGAWSDTIPTVKDAGSYIVNVKATKINYNNKDVPVVKAESAVYPFNVYIAKADQKDFNFEQDEYGVQYGTATLTVIATGGQSNGTVTYEIISGGDIGTVASADNKGTITFNSGKKGVITVKATLDGGQNYNDITALANVKVNTNDFSGKYVVEPAVPATGWYTNDVAIKPAEGYKIALSEHFAADWKDNIIIDTEGRNIPDLVYLKEIATGYIGEGIQVADIYIDKTAPVSLEISYSKSIIDVLLETITFGFYKAKMTVTLEATDNISKIDHFAYQIGDSPQFIINKAGIVFDGDDGEIATASFRISPNLNRSKITLTAFDTAGHSTTIVGDMTLIVDDIAPVVTVSYDNNDANYDLYFKRNRTATIAIKEENFFKDNLYDEVFVNDENGIPVAQGHKYLTITVGKRLTNEAAYTNTIVEPVFTKDGDVYKATVEFTEEADYTFDVEFYDYSLNKNLPVDYGDSVAPKAFTIDKTPPTAMDIKIDNISVAGPMNTFAFNRFYNSAVSVKLLANCDISGMDSFKYQKVANVTEYDVKGDWRDYNDATGIIVSPSEKFVIYFRAEDRAGNVAIIRSTGIVVDNQKPIGERKAPEIDILPMAPNNRDGIYNGNVRVNLKVVEPKYIGAKVAANGHYSGLNRITYRIYTTDTRAIETGTLFQLGRINAGAQFDADKLVSSWTGMITIDSNKFNSNNTIVEVTATDNAGNSRISTTAAGDIKIDTTAPEIDISYDNNATDSGTFFKADRTARIVITERNFDPDDVVIKITNTDGVIPRISAWSKTEGAGNRDNTRWTATIPYTADGDYTFSIEYTDLAGNKCRGEAYAIGTQAAREFTIDKTVPTIAVSYDNNSMLNGNYYKADRTATIVITEHNFSADRVNITLKATDDGKDIALPTISQWTSSGNNHTATIKYNKDGLYTFDIAVSDKAGNDSADFEAQSFYVDKTAPTIEITGVADRSANRGDIIPIISYSDTNFDDNQVKITLTGAIRKEVELEGSYEDQHNGKVFTFKNFAKEESVDDIYTLAVLLTDKAGNTTEQTIMFSANRFGSTYGYGSTAEKINGSYVQQADDIVMMETNADELKNIKITLFKNNETIVLEEGKDYRIDVKGGSGQWHEYTYTVFAKNFEDDGIYRLTFHSEDAAGNVAENTLDTKDKEINFGVDKTKPNVVVTNLVSGKTYPLEKLTVSMFISDNLLLKSVVVYLDNYDEAYKTWDAEEIAGIIESNGEFTFDVLGDSTRAHNVKIVCTDEAGNEQIEEITDFYVTMNLFVRYYNNKALFFGSIGGVILIAGLVITLVVIKKRKIS